MAKKSKNNKNLIIGICAGVAALVVIIVLVVVLVVNSGRINDDYFKTDDTKFVFSMETGSSNSEDGESDTPVKIHEVYTYEGETITGQKYYYEFVNAEAAKNALEAEKENFDDSFENIELNDKYIVMTVKPEQYQDLTTTDVRENYELFEKLNNLGSKEETEEEQ